uniref:Uncharacterized protein n=1 Tax=Ananas comosus var. bracteatus TaxID=296719 RepID=A0A6V7PTN2_ANACO|nr:unnamed protein product [Ananas comosus var. bracteatus]
MYPTAEIHSTSCTYASRIYICPCPIPLFSHTETMAEKEGAVVKTGHDAGMKLAVSLLEEFGLPLGLLPLADVSEVGFVKATGYMWIAQKNKIQHSFKMVSKLVSYDTEISGYVEKRRIKKLKGVKAKELMLWPPVNEIAVDDPRLGRCISRASPASPRPSQSRLLLLGSRN